MFSNSRFLKSRGHVDPLHRFTARRSVLLIRGERAKKIIYFWGESGSGKTHLLNGCCDFARLQNRRSVYLPIGTEHDDGSLPNGFDYDFDCKGVVCIDDLQNLKGNRESQEALFTLYEQLNAQDGVLIIAANQPPTQIQLELKDLESRLTSGGIFTLSPLSDEAKREALILRASQRGFELETRAVDFIMTHYDRDTPALFALFEELDRASLSEHRKITIPFIKRLIDNIA